MQSSCGSGSRCCCCSRKGGGAIGAGRGGGARPLSIAYARLAGGLCGLEGGGEAVQRAHGHVVQPFQDLDTVALAKVPRGRRGGREHGAPDAAADVDEPWAGGLCSGGGGGGVLAR